jgi:YidC/Oxa1 family membrane protein insertase
VLDVLASPVGALLALIHRGLSSFLISGSGPAWAFSIVLLTVTVRLLLFPLFVKQIKSQRRMQELAPKIKELQKQHKGDRETLNTEMMKLYKDNNANPISGCLPLLLQLPVFFALFTVIRNFDTEAASDKYGLTVQQLREGAAAKVFGAPISAQFNDSAAFVSNLDADLTTVRIVAAIMVVLMGATTYWTQRQMIARSGTTDPQQVMIQKLLLYVLPLSFAVSGAFFPIGVLLYWLTTNVWSMGQQAYVIKRMPPVVFTPTTGGPKAVPAKDAKPGDKGSDAPTAGTKGKNKGPKGSGAAAAPVDLSKGPKGGSASADGGSGAAPQATVASRGGSAPLKTSGSTTGARKAAGSRKNKNRRGGRR